MCTASALAPSILALSGFRFVTAIAAAAGMVISRAIVRDLADGHEAAILMFSPDAGDGGRADPGAQPGWRDPGVCILAVDFRRDGDLWRDLLRAGLPAAAGYA